MHSLIFLFAIIAAGHAARPVTSDKDALVAFALMSTQYRGGSPTDLLNTILPFIIEESNDIEHDTKMMLLAAGGLSPEKSQRMLDEVLPTLKSEGKSINEQVTAMLLLSNQYCPRKTITATCPSDEEDLVSLVTMRSERGCREYNIQTNIIITGRNKCVCDEQDDILLWISLLDKISSSGKAHKSDEDFLSHIPNQIPVILMMLMNESPCNGTIKGTSEECRCTQVTEGNERFLLQYMINSPGSENILTESAKAKVQRMSSQPGIRALDISSALLATGDISSPYLSLLLNSGGSTQEQLMNLIFSNLELDSSLIQLVLNNGFNDNSNKVGMINYLANMGIVPPDTVPFLVGADKGSQFYINSMLETGAIDPLFGMLTLAMQSGASQADIFEFITQSMAGGNDPDYFSSFGKPYIPSLPSGIYPGSHLYFAHLETLGVNTCALHDLRNRFDCGFNGIGAAQCEILPYCCYNPVFVTDAEIQAMTGGQITSALQVPWCYYNVFFIYYDSFSLMVKRPGEFAAPASCLPLFKYGLNIDSSIYYLYAQQSGSNALSAMVNKRTECGFPGITEFHCVAIRGCCWDAYASFKIPQCYDANGPTAFNFNLNTVPVAYLPMNGTCNVNYFQFPILYYRRVACMPTWEMFVNGRDPLKLPTKYECLWKLGCCWEDYEEVGKKFPYSPRCYRREDGAYNVRPSAIGQVSNLVARSGNTDIDFQQAKKDEEMRFREMGFAPVTY